MMRESLVGTEAALSARAESHSVGQGPSSSGAGPAPRTTTDLEPLPKAQDFGYPLYPSLTAVPLALTINIDLSSAPRLS